ncbi:hypothetical protein HII31_07697 [Pseudocercospora fuligena]|uniref:Uncharacterized protein n=1 Tax=Pseudocercospora fuligena TaxID=685502 RepID=A0A8H6RHN0_9PEZI|nr:hypothetical protein HII31_07697 [Pseudocercospora fuligena]
MGTEHRQESISSTADQAMSALRSMKKQNPSDRVVDNGLNTPASWRTASEHCRSTIDMNSFTVNPPRAPIPGQVRNNISNLLRSPQPRLSSDTLLNHPPQMLRHAHHTIRSRPTRRHNIHSYTLLLRIRGRQASGQMLQSCFRSTIQNESSADKWIATSNYSSCCGGDVDDTSTFCDHWED